MSVKDAAELDNKANPGAKSFAQNTLLMSVLTTISRITGLLRITAILAVVGGGFIADSYNLANIIPNYIYELVMGGILSSLVIPIFIDYLTNKSKDEAYEIVSTILNLALIIFGTIAVLGIFLPSIVVKAITSISGSKNTSLAVFFFRFFAIQVVFYSLASIATGVLYSHKRFAVPTFAPILNNVIVISTVVFIYGPNFKTNPQLALTSLAIGTTAGVFILFAVQIPSLLKVGFQYTPHINLKHPAIRKSAGLAFALFLYALGNIIPMGVEVGLSWRFRTGVTALQSAWPFFQLPFGIFVVSIANALFPSLSENIAKGNMEEFKKHISLGLRTIGMISLPASVLIIILSKPIIYLVLMRGEFTFQEANLTAGVLSYFAFGLFFFSSFFFLLRAFYARQKTFIPAAISLAGMVFNIAVDLVLIRYLSVKGLALGRSLTYFLSFLAIWFMLKREIGGLDKHIFTSNLKFFTASVVMGVVAFFSLKMITPIFSVNALYSRLMLFSVPAVLSTLTYLSVIGILKSPEIKLVRNLFKKPN